jgi:tRNA(Ile)-lysidine synthase
MVDLVDGEQGGRALDLPGGATLRGEYGYLTLTRSRDQDCPYPAFDGEYPIELPTEDGVGAVVSAGPWRVTMRLDADSGHDWPRDAWSVCLDPEALGEGISVRAWRLGDRVQPLGMQGQKKLQDLFTDLKVPRHWRGKVPLLDSEKGIAWVVGHRMADWAKVGDASDGPVLRMTFSLAEDQSI